MAKIRGKVMVFLRCVDRFLGRDVAWNLSCAQFVKLQRDALSIHSSMLDMLMIAIHGRPFKVRLVLDYLSVSKIHLLLAY